MNNENLNQNPSIDTESVKPVEQLTNESANELQANANETQASANESKSGDKAQLIQILKSLWDLFRRYVVHGIMVFMKFCFRYVMAFFRFCLRSLKALLGQMAAGTMLGLLVALFMALCYCPVMYYAYNSYFNYDAYLKPYVEDSPNPYQVKGHTNINYEIVLLDKNRQAADETLQDISNQNASSDNNEFVYNIYSVKASGERKELFSVIINDKTDQKTYVKERLLTLNVRKYPSKPQSASGDGNPISVGQPADNKPAENKSAEDKPAEDKSAEDKPAEDKPAEDKPAEDKPAENKTVENNATENNKEQEVSAGELVAWNKTANIAPSNSIFVLKSFMGVIKYPSYPTSITAFSSWLREYGKDSLELKDTSKEDIAIISASLERVLDNQWRFQKKGDMFLLFSRCINGSIQFICFVLFTAALILLISRFIVVQLCDPLRWLSTSEQEKVKQDKDACIEQINRFKDSFGFEPPTLALWREELSNNERHERVSLSETVDILRKFRETSLDYVTFLIESIPALGFVGTIIGIGMTMMNTCSVIASDIARQQSRITDLSLDLAFAFDTTLVGILLSLVVGFCIKALVYGEQSAINLNSTLIMNNQCGKKEDK